MEVDIDKVAQRYLEIIRKNFKITTCIERHLPDDMYTQASIFLMDAFETGVFEDFEKMLDTDVQTILYSYIEIQGKTATSKYLKKWQEKNIILGSIDTLAVKLCHFCSHACLISSHQKDDKILFLFNFKNAKIFQILLMPMSIDAFFEDFVYSTPHLYVAKIESHPWYTSNMLYFLYKFDFMLPKKYEIEDIVYVDEQNDVGEDKMQSDSYFGFREQDDNEIDPGAFKVYVDISGKDFFYDKKLNKKDHYLEKAMQIFSVKYDLINLFCAKKNTKSVPKQEIENIFLKQKVQKLLSALTEIELCDNYTLKITTKTTDMEEYAPDLMISGKDNDLFHIWEQNEIDEIVCIPEIDKDIYISKLDIDKHICVNPTEMGAWQLFLLVNLSIILPSYCWHMSYGRKEYVFNETDLENVINKNNSYHNRELKHLMNLLKNNLPKVEMVEKSLLGCTIQIECCYWDDWLGLNKEETTITIAEHQCVSYETKTTNLYHSYNNGIYF